MRRPALGLRLRHVRRAGGQHAVEIPACRLLAGVESRCAAGASCPCTPLRRSAAPAVVNRKACVPYALRHSVARAGIGRLSDTTRNGASIAN
jgi:hypothetical protein